MSYDFRTLEGLCRAMHQHGVDAGGLSPSAVGLLDQEKTRAREDLAAECDIDLTDPEQARVAAGIGIYVLARTRNAGQRLTPAAYAALAGICFGVLHQHHDPSAQGD